MQKKIKFDVTPQEYSASMNRATFLFIEVTLVVWHQTF